MNPEIDYKIKVALYHSEVTELVNQIGLCYRMIKEDSDSLSDFLIGYHILKPVVKKYQMDRLRNTMEGYVRTKAYSVKLNKLDCLWLYKFIETHQLIELSNLHTNILGPHIQEYL